MPKKTKPNTSRSAEWAETLRQIPGYDPFATAGDSVFDAGAAERAVGFFEKLLTHTKGELAGRPFILEPWEKAIIANIFGWKRPDGTRRYREVFVFVPRKNGKSLLASGLCNYGLFGDAEPGAEIYTAAAERDQAALVWDIAKRQVLAEPVLRKACRVFQRAITIESNGSSLKPISADASTKHGYNAHIVVVDELHAQKNPELVEVLKTSMGSRRQPLMVYITTSDFERPSICNRLHDYAGKVRDGLVDDPAFLPVIYEAKRSDDWRDPVVWAKANPNLGVSLDRGYLERECQRAIDEPSYQNTFLRLHLNIRTEQSVRWIDMGAWDRCGEAFDPAELEGAECFGGLDLSTTVDVSAFVLYFPESKRTLAWYWIPRDNARERERRDRVPYLTWAREASLEMTEGNVVDYNHIRSRINQLAKMYAITDIGYDPWNARHLAGQLADDDGLPMVEFRQGYVSMNEPCKRLEGLVTGGQLRHGGDPVLRWMASNVTVKSDPAGNIKIDKARSAEKVDGMVALAMAIGRSLVSTGAFKSVYETRGILTL